MLRGALAAALTPLCEQGAALDEDAFAPYLNFLAAAGLDGILALGTTGEGILLSAAERRRAAELFLEGPLPVIVHCGAQTTAETVALADHAAASGAAGVAVIGPPYYALDQDALFAHFAAAARACGPLSFYVYEFKARSGYAVPVGVIERLRLEISNLAGLKVSDRPLDAVEPYLLEGLDVFVGAEELLPVRGAAGKPRTLHDLGNRQRSIHRRKAVEDGENFLERFDAVVGRHSASRCLMTRRPIRTGDLTVRQAVFRDTISSRITSTSPARNGG